MSHAKVIVEDCVSRCPSHLPEPTQEELDMEKDWEPDPPPHLDLEKLAAQSDPTTGHTREDLPHGGGADMYEPCVRTK